LTKKTVNTKLPGVLELEVIDRPKAAALVLDPVKSRILAALATPGSAASLASTVGLSRQKVNYHLRALEEHQLVEPVDERLWGGIKERRLVATAASYVVSPAALGPLAADPARNSDRLSASYLVALAARIVREVGELARRARKTDKRLATLSLDLVIRFKSPADRAAFTAGLTSAITSLAAHYHDEGTPGGRPHRLVVASYPAPDQGES
jgi:DNA-binding transcriptional ArsR family regulator